MASGGFQRTAIGVLVGAGVQLGLQLAGYLVPYPFVAATRMIPAEALVRAVPYALLLGGLGGALYTLLARLVAARAAGTHHLVGAVLGVGIAVAAFVLAPDDLSGSFAFIVVGAELVWGVLVSILFRRLTGTPALTSSSRAT